jgi:hypothetical protein
MKNLLEEIPRAPIPRNSHIPQLYDQTTASIAFEVIEIPQRGKT